jgi:hypothetical protein
MQVLNSDSVDVLNDELQAYITDNDDKFIKENVAQSIIDQFNQLYQYHSKQH